MKKVVFGSIQTWKLLRRFLFGKLVFTRLFIRRFFVEWLFLGRLLRGRLLSWQLQEKAEADLLVCISKVAFGGLPAGYRGLSNPFQFQLSFFSSSEPFNLLT